MPIRNVSIARNNLGHMIKYRRTRIATKKGNNQTQTNVVTKIKKAIGTSNSTWYMDSGATQHMCHQIQGITKYIKSKNRQIVYLGDHSTSYTLE